MSPKVPLARRLLQRDRGRFLVTTTGVAVVVALILFILTIFEGVQHEATGYVASRETDVWVSLMNSNNLIRSTSYMLETIGEAMDTLPEVAGVAPLLRAIARTDVGGRSMGFFVLGIDPNQSVTRPEVVKGSSAPQRGDIILDRAFAAAHDIRIGQNIRVQESVFRVTGLSKGTNAIATQFAFTTVEDAEILLGFPGLISFWLVNGEPGIDPHDLASAIKGHLPELNPIPHGEFVENNRDELRTGVIPLLWSIALFAAAAGAVTLTLLLYGGVMERRADYALLKALGANQRWVDRLVLRQALIVVSGGLLVGGAGFALSVPVLLLLVPQLTFRVTPFTVGVVAGLALGLGAAAAVLPVHRLKRIYPGEVFRP